MSGRTARTLSASAVSAIGAPASRISRRTTLAVGVLLVLAVLVVGVGLWLQDGLPRALGERLYPVEYKAEIAAAAGRYDVDPYLVAAVVKAESGFEAGAVSSAGAVGLMQLMPDTADWIATRPDWEGRVEPVLTDPADNVALGTYYLAYLLERFGNDEATALAAYNAGQGVVETWLNEASAGSGEDGGPAGSAALRPDDVPFPETRGFIERVMRFRDLYRDVHPQAFQL
jgi:soluble lytic murein transglycosylase